MRNRISMAILFVVGSAALLAQEARNPVPSLQKQASIQQEWLKERLEKVLPALMRGHGVDMWVVPMREYNEDPVFSSLVSATTFAARRRTIYVFFDRGYEKGIERLALGGSSQGGLYAAYRDTTLQNAELWGKEQWNLLKKVIDERNPESIAINISPTHAFSDGLSAGEWEQLQEVLGPEYLRKVVRAERLPLDFIALRVSGMMPVYEEMMKTVHAIISEAFSNEVIVPGKTRTEDVVWWMRQRTHELGFGTWFQPSVDIQRQGADLSRESNPVILRGDVLHCDYGLTLMRLHTDTQHMGYVLRQGEKGVPAGVLQALKNSNRLQDLVLENMKVGKTGNEILRNTLDQMKNEGIEGTVYSHPIGENGHGAGPLIGLWDRQQGVPGRGDVPVLANTWFSVELQASTAIPEWSGQKIRSAQEEDVEVTADGKIRWIYERQTDFHIVR